MSLLAGEYYNSIVSQQWISLATLMVGIFTLLQQSRARLINLTTGSYCDGFYDNNIYTKMGFTYLKPMGDHAEVAGRRTIEG
jgi:hypothetical protein